ncbi:MAG TPA: AAA family ATPase, partial [Polyangiaceae bacterium]
MSQSEPSGLERPRIKAALVGRSRQLAELNELFEMARSGHACMGTLIGPAGIGKSRLVAEACAMHTNQQADSVRVCQAAARASDMGYGAVGRLLRDRFGLNDAIPEMQRVERLTHEVSQILDDRNVNDVCYFLGQLTGVKFPMTPVTRAVADDPVEASLVRRALLRRFLEADAAKVPLCWVVEDLHGIDADSLDFLAYLGRSARGRI